MHEPAPLAEQALLVGMDESVGTVASRIFTRKISWDNLVAVHNADRFLSRVVLNRTPAEERLAQRLRDSLTEQFGQETMLEDITSTLLTYLLDRAPKEWPDELTKLAESTKPCVEHAGPPA